MSKKADSCRDNGMVQFLLSCHPGLTPDRPHCGVALLFNSLFLIHSLLKPGSLRKRIDNTHIDF